MAGAADRCRGAVRVVATYDVFSITFDEPAHIAAGMQLLDENKYTYEALHPPLARVAAAIGPYLAGYRSQHGGDMWIEGRRLFYAKSGHPDVEMLTLARAGILPFMIFCLVLVWLWTSRYVGPVEGALAVIVLGNLPVLSGAFRARDDRRGVCRDLYRGLFRVRAVARARLSRREGCCWAPPSRSPSVPNCPPCCFCRRRAARCCSIAGGATGRIGSRSSCSRHGAARWPRSGLFL